MPTHRKKRGRTKGRSIEPKALARVRDLLGDAPRRHDLLLEHLHRIQDSEGCITVSNLVALAGEMRLSVTEVYEVASFYHHLDLVREDQSPPPSITVRVCDSLACAMAGAEILAEDLKNGLGDGVRVQRVSCVGRCADAPVAVIGMNPVGEATLDTVRSRVEERDTSPVHPSGRDYDAYRAAGGYQLLGRVEKGALPADEVIQTLEDAGLRGLGGAGFPAGRKWRIVRDQPEPRLMAVNIDEGEPGTFKDRHFLEQDPHRFLEGILIASRVVGISKIYIYLRDEYAGIRGMLQQELNRLLENLPWDMPPVELRRGAGAYICGEESAMIESIEGQRGMPRLRPPYVAQAGLFGRPTLVHNMETLFWVPELLERGAGWFREQGRRGHSGLRAFSVSGRVALPGVYLAPAGISLRELITEHCGGMQEGHELYAYLPGGASGGILPASMADIPLDFDTLQPHGCFLGSAAIIVLSQQDSAREAAVNAMHFFARESCGRCTPCRVGTEKAARLMEQPEWDRDLLEELAAVMTDASICGLGQAAPNPLLSVLKYFPDEVKDD